ncbi:hypothetical protein JQ625_10865 [Bradyrhizobium diazoefficiens]|nr:hypothetical protein [Bradyrhizobium diazoefficiens]MBR0775333.1 hypothetical protein [Bradyrhizobium diazoefficiens]
MYVADLEARIQRLPAKKAEDRESKKALLRWLKVNPRRRKGSDWWNRIQLPDAMLWLGTAAGETRERLRVAREAAEREWYIATRARIVRKYVPWEVLAEMLFGRGAK